MSPIDSSLVYLSLPVDGVRTTLVSLAKLPLTSEEEGLASAEYISKVKVLGKKQSERDVSKKLHFRKTAF